MAGATWAEWSRRGMHSLGRARRYGLKGAPERRPGCAADASSA